MANFEHAEDEQRRSSMPGALPAASAPEPHQASRAAGGAAAAVPCIIPSFAAASELLSAPYSCLVLNPHRRHVALAPQYLNKKRTGLQEELDGELLKFSQSLNGVPLAYDSIGVVGHHGHIYDDSGYIHMDIEANFIVFQPKTGQKLLGKVNKLGLSHVGCLVHGCFNASIPKPNLVCMETWRDAGPRIGTELEFIVKALDADAAGVLLIRGQLDRTRVQELLAMSESSESGVPANQPEPQEAQEAEPAAEPTPEPPDDTPKKKKKKKKKKKEKEKVKEEEIEEEITSTAPSQLNGTTDETNGGERKKKKRKKDKYLKEEEQEMEISQVEDNGSNSSSGEKPRRKRKHESGTDPTSGVSEDQTPTKSKKRRKVETEQFS